MGMRRPLALAAELGRLGSPAVVVGGTARHLRDGAGDPADLDLAVADADLPALVAALARLGSPVGLRSLERCRCVRVATAWGPLDVFVGDVPTWREVRMDGVAVRVAA